MGIGIIGVSPICSTIPNARSTARVVWLVQPKMATRIYPARISYVERLGELAVSCCRVAHAVHTEHNLRTYVHNRICIDLVIYTTYPNLRDTASLADYSPKLWPYARCADRPMALRARI